MTAVVHIASGASERSRADAVGAQALAVLAARGHTVGTIRVRDLPPGPLLWGQADHPGLASALASVAQADALIVSSPVYQASFAGALKVFLDLLPRRALRGKEVLPLMVGGSRGHVLALDYALRPVLQSLGAASVHAGRFVLDSEVDATRTGEGHLAPDAAADVEATAVQLARSLEQRSASEHRATA